MKRRDFIIGGISAGGLLLAQPRIVLPQRVRRRPIFVAGGGVVKADTFVETSDTALESHTPTGPNAGTSWVQHNSTWTLLHQDKGGF
jgi:hypothetical protein